jgi:protease-4
LALEADLLIDRRRLKRRLSFWRVVAVVALVAVALVSVPRGRIGGALGQRIARYQIDGVIGDGRDQIEALDSLRGDAGVAGVLLHLDTPGGQVAGGEALHDAVEKLAAAKPVVAVMDGTAASAGYMIAVATPHIVARDSTLTGSIGVILETGDASALLEKIGIKSEALVSGPLKGQPSFTEPLSPAGRDYLQGLVADLYDQFVGIVAHGRHMDAARVRQLADGRAYTGRQAKALGLVDEIGGEAEALRWMQQARHVPSSLPVRDVATGSYLQQMVQSSLDGLVVSASRALRVDGVWALWQPNTAR